MSEVFSCEDKETLVAYLYGEVDTDVRREVERHLRTCTGCLSDVDGLQEIRQDLQLWSTPEPELGFSIASQPANIVRPSRWAVLRDLPAWAQVAAAALVIGVGAAIANVQVHSTSDGLTVTTGWMTPAAPLSVAAPVPAAASTGEWRRELAALEQTLRSEMTAQQSGFRTALSATPETNATVDTGAVLRRVQSMIDDSEERQRQEMALRFLQANRVWETRWSSDRQTLSRELLNLQGRTLAVQAGQQEMLNQFRLHRVVAPQPNQ